MDVKLQSGGIEFESTNTSERMVCDIDVVFQRIEIALSVKKSEFLYNREMGITLPKLDYEDERSILTLEMYINEAIYEICNYVCKIKNLDIVNNKVNLQIIAEDKVYEREVKLGGEL